MDSASIESVHQQVKAALQDLHQHGIGFDDLVHEGLDPVTLKGLYSEVGIHVPSPGLQSPFKLTVSAPTRHTNGGSSLPEKPPASENALLVAPPPEESNHIQEVAPEITIDIESNSLQCTEKATIDDQQSQSKMLPVTTIPPVPLSNKQDDTAMPKKPSPKPITQAKPQQIGSTTEKGADKVIDRKEYIAKLMAAKGGKGAITKPAKQPLTKVNPTPKLSPTTSATQVETLGKSESKAPSAKAHVSEAEAKRAAQTELARKKIEALKQSNMSKMEQSAQKQTQQPLVSMAEPSTPQKDPISSNVKKPDPKPVKIPEPLVQTQNAVSSQVATPFTPSTSFFSSLGRSKTTSIPGLLMGNHSSPSLFPSTTSAATSLVDATPKTLPLRSTSQPESDSGLSLPDQPSSVSVQAQPEQVSSINQSVSVSEPNQSKPSSAEMPAELEESFIATPKAIVVETSPSRKRPTASDFIDAPPSRLKRRLGTHQQDDIILVLSDEGETEDESDSINVTSTVSHNPMTTASSTEAKTTKPIRDLPPLTDFPPRPKSLVNAATTTPLVQPPGKPTEQEMLKAKEEQILAMQRRIAEMEMKRASKRVAGFSSPDSNQAKHVSRSTSNPPQLQQVVPTPSRPPIETETMQADIEIPNFESRAAEVDNLQAPFGSESQKPRPALGAHSSQAVMAKRLQVQQNKARIEEIERSLLRTTEEVDSINAKLVVARREIVTSEEELQNLLGQKRDFVDELDSLRRASETLALTDAEVTPVDEKMANGLSSSEPHEDQPGK